MLKIGVRYLLAGLMGDEYHVSDRRSREERFNPRELVVKCGCGWVEEGRPGTLNGSRQGNGVKPKSNK